MAYVCEISFPLTEQNKMKVGSKELKHEETVLFFWGMSVMLIEFFNYADDLCRLRCFSERLLLEH